MPKVIRRSWLIVPSHDAMQVEQAIAVAPDVVVLDLMDFVPEAAKPAAREQLQEMITQITRHGAEAFVQIDKDLLYADLHAAVWPGVSGILIPHLESPHEVAAAEDLLTKLEDARGIRPGTLQLVAVLDTAKGNHAAMDIARSSPRMWGLTLGRADLVMDLRPEPSGELHLMPYLMQRLITIATAAGLVPIGAWWRAPARGLLANPDDTYHAAVRGRRVGFQGALCLRPDQVEALQRGFTPEAVELEAARALITAYDEVAQHGTAVLRLQERIVDRATVLQAKHLLAEVDACTQQDLVKEQARQRAPH
jgi:citrate lyase subunit beta / citryl-CoA lyase